MALWPTAWSLIALSAVVGQGAIQEPVRAQYYEALASAWNEGLQSLVSKLDAAAKGAPGASFTPQILETIQTIALLHPGSVPDESARWQVIKSQAQDNPSMAKVARRLEIVQEYYAAALRGRPETAVAALADPAFEGSIVNLYPRADAALRMGDYNQADTFAQQIIEADPFSPLLANSYVILGLSAAYRGDAATAVRMLHRATTVSPLPTVYGRTQDYLALLVRFIRPTPAPLGGMFEEMTLTRIAGTQELRDPHGLIFQNGRFILLDKDQILTLSSDGKVTETKGSRNIEDLAVGPSGKFCILTGESVDPGTGSATKLTTTMAGKPKTLSKLRSLALDARGDLYMLDQDAGLLRAAGAATGAISLTQLASTKGRLVRIDRRGYIHVLTSDQRSIMVLSQDGKMLTSVAPVTPAGKEASIEYFALDSLNHIYILDLGSNSIQIFAVNDGRGALQKLPVCNLPLEQRPHHKNLRVIGVADTGEMVVTGKNEGNWVRYR